MFVYFGCLLATEILSKLDKLINIDESPNRLPVLYHTLKLALVMSNSPKIDLC